MTPRITFPFRFLNTVIPGLLLLCPVLGTMAATTYQVVKIPGLTTSGTTFGWAINARGQVTGWLQTSNGPPHAIIYSDGITKDLGSLGGIRAGSYGVAINNRGEVAGTSDLNFGSSAQHAFLYSNGGLSDLGTLGGPGSFPNGINVISLGTTAPALPLSIAFGVNNHRVVVGEVYNNSTDIYHAFIYQDARMQDLNNLVNLESGMVLSDAQAINDAGQIVANGNNGGNNYAFLLTPNCEPPRIKSVSAQPPRVWPPNHKMQKITVAVDTTAQCGPVSTKIASITSNDSEPGNGPKAAEADFEITGDLTANVRAEKSGKAGERTYSLTIECTDAVGNVSYGAATVIVAPPSQ